MEIIASESLLFVGVAILVLVHICIVGRAYRREIGPEGGPNIKGLGLTLESLKKLPCFEYKQEVEEETCATNDTASIECAICLDSFKVGDSCKILPNCNHYFHVHCVDVWLRKNTTCPICRTCAIVMPKETFEPPKVAPDLGDLGGNNYPSTVHVADDLC